MQESIRPIFTKGRVVKKESLDSLRDFPREFLRLAMREDTDGLLYGFSITAEENSILISPGAIKHRGEIILIQGEHLPFAAFDQCVCVKACIHPAEYTEDAETVKVELITGTTLSLGENEWELGRFILARGAALRTDYTGVSDFKTAHNTLDLTGVLFAGEGKATMSPRLMKLFAGFLLESGTENQVDTAFAFTCLNSRIVQRDTILWYIAKRTGSPFMELTNEEIYQRLVLLAGNKRDAVKSQGGLVRRTPVIG